MSEHNKRRLSSQVDNGSQPKWRRASETDAGGSTQQDQGHGTLSTQKRNEDRSETPGSTADDQYLYSHEFRKQYGKENTVKKFSTISINANGLKKHFGQIHDYLVQLAYPWHIIGVSETHLKMEHDVSGLNIAGYNFITENRETGGGGVALYVHKSVKYERRHDLKLQVPVKEGQAKCNSLFIEIPVDGKNIIVGIIYRANSSSKDELKKSVSGIFGTIRQESKISYIMGDFNINVLRKCNQSFKDLGHPDHEILINSKTRFTKDSATLIDNIFTNAHFAKVNTTQGVLITDISDHFPVFQVSGIEITCITRTGDTWITDEIRELIKKKEEELYRYLHERIECHCTSCRYNKIKNELKNAIATAKKDYSVTTHSKLSASYP